MRVGWMAAAAAMVCGAPASAATYLTYTIEADGYQVSGNAIGGDVTSQSYVTAVFRFTLPFDGGSGADNMGNTVSCLLSVCTASGASARNFRADASLSGRLVVSDGFGVAGIVGNRGADVSYVDPDGVGGFPVSLGSVSATGSVSSLLVDYTSNRGTFLNATVRTLTVSVGSGTQLISIETLPGVVPEPASWAMMIVGAGLIGAGARRRRTSAIA